MLHSCQTLIHSLNAPSPLSHWPLQCSCLTPTHLSVQFSSVQWIRHVCLFATPLIAARQASLSITNSRSLLKLRAHSNDTSSEPSLGAHMRLNVHMTPDYLPLRAYHVWSVTYMTSPVSPPITGSILYVSNILFTILLLLIQILDHSGLSKNICLMNDVQEVLDSFYLTERWHVRR